MATYVALAAKEKGKIVSASPDSPTLEKLSTFSQQIRSALHCFSAVATRANALWQRSKSHSQRQTPTVATRANALWQRGTCGRYETAVASQPARMRCGKDEVPAYDTHGSISRNPRECAVAKAKQNYTMLDNLKSQPARMRCGKVGLRGCGCGGCSRNPRECAVAKRNRTNTL